MSSFCVIRSLLCVYVSGVVEKTTPSYTFWSLMVSIAYVVKLYINFPALGMVVNLVILFGLTDRQWFYQTCTEFGYFLTTDSDKQPFGNLISLEMSTKACQVLFDIDASTVAKNVDQTNSMYGGKEIGESVTNIVFPNGSIDPWHALGVTESISDSLVAIFINGTAHCANMYPESPNDPPQLVKAREQISAMIKVWLTSA